MSTSLPSVSLYTPNSPRGTTAISFVSSGANLTPLAVCTIVNSAVKYEAEFPSLLTHVTDEKEQTREYETEEEEYEARCRADLKIVESWNRSYARVTTAPARPDANVPVKTTADVKVVEKTTNGNVDLSKFVNRWVTFVPSRTHKVAMKKKSGSKPEQLIVDVKDSAKVSTASRAPVAAYAEKVKSIERDQTETAKARKKPVAGQKKEKQSLVPAQKLVPRHVCYAPMRSTVQPHTKKWVKVPASRKGVCGKLSVDVCVDQVPVLNKFDCLPEACGKELTSSAHSFIGQKAERVNHSRKPREPKMKKKRSTAKKQSLMTEETPASDNQLEHEPSIMFLFLLKMFLQFSGLNARVLPVCSSTDVEMKHECCLISPGNDYDILYVPFVGRSDVEAMAICDRRRRKEKRSRQSITLCMTNCEASDKNVASTISRLQHTLDMHGWRNYSVSVRIFKSSDPEMCLLDVVKWFSTNPYSCPVMFNKPKLEACLREGYEKRYSLSLPNMNCAMSWKNECSVIQRCTNTSLCGGGGVDATHINASFVHKLVNVCFDMRSDIRILGQNAFKNVSRQKCCVVREDNNYSFLVIPVLADESEPRALLLCDRRCTPPNVINLLPVLPAGVPRWGKADDKTVKKLLEMNGFQKYKYKVIRRKDCEDPALYLLTALTTILNGSYQEIDFATLAAEPSLTMIAASAVATEHFSCAFSRGGCCCGKVDVAVIETTPVKARAETPKPTPLKRKSNVTQLSPSTVSPSPGKTRRLFQDKLTKGILKNAKIRREKALVIGSLSTLKYGQWVEGEVLNAFMRLVQQMTDSSFRILDSNLCEFDSLESRVPGFPLKGEALHPINVGRVHWCLGVFDFEARKVTILDSDKSVKAPSSDCVSRVLKIWTICTNSNLPSKSIACNLEVCEQTDGFNCGMFTCYHALCLMSERSIDTNFTSAVADKFREIVAEFLRRNVLVRDEDGKIFESGVYMFPSDSLVMAKQMPELDLKVQDQPLPVPIFPKTVSAERRTTSRGTPARSNTPNSRVSLARKSALDVVVVSDDSVLKTPSKSVPNTTENYDIVQVCSTPTTIDKVSAKLNSSCILDDGKSPIQQRRITRSSSRTPSTRQPVVETSETPNPPDLVAPTVVSKTVSGKRRTTPRVTPVRSTTPKSRVSLGRRKASDVGVVSERTPAKSVGETYELSNVVPVCSTPNTIDRVSAQLASQCNVEEGQSPLKQPRLTRSSSRKVSTRQLFSDSVPNTIDKMTAKLEDTILSHDSESPRKQPRLLRSTSIAKRSSRQLFSNEKNVQSVHSDITDVATTIVPSLSSDPLTSPAAQTCNLEIDDVPPPSHGCDPSLGNVNARFDPLPMVKSTAKIAASRAALDNFKGTSLKQIVKVLCSNASTKVAVLSQYALKYGGISRSCCYVSRNPHDLLVMLYEEKRHPVAMLVCDRRRSSHTVTLFAPSTSSVRVENTFADTILPIHEWYDYSGKVIRRDNVTDLKAYFANTLHSVLIDESYDESDLGTSRVAKFLLDHPGIGTSLVNGGCGFFDGPCPCAIPRAIDDGISRPSNHVTPIMYDVAVADPQPATQAVSDRTVWTKKTQFFNALGEKKELCLDSLKSLRRDGTELERYLQDDVVYAFCSVVSVSQLDINCIVDPQLLENDETYVLPDYPVVNGIRYFPICNAQHWVLAVFHFEKRSVTVLDSQQHQKGSMTVRGDVQKIVILAWRRFTDLPLPSITSAPLSEIAEQNAKDNYNCGVYVCYHVARALMRWTDNPAEFTTQSANEYRGEITRVLSDNFYVAHEDFNGLIPSHVEQLVQAPLPLQTLVVANQDIVRPQYHAGKAASAVIVGSKLPHKDDTATKKKSAKNCAPMVTDYYLPDGYMTSSSEEEQEDGVAQSPQQVSNLTVQNSITPFLHFLPRVCASSTRKVVLMSHHTFLNSKIIQKCCVYDRKNNPYEVLVLPIVLGADLCAVAIGEKMSTPTNNGKKARKDRMTLILIDKTSFSCNQNEKNNIVAVFASHGMKNLDVKRIQCTAGTVSNCAQLISQARCIITGENLIQATTDDEIRTALNGIPQYSEFLQGSLMNGLCQTVTGTCGCPFSNEMSLVCSFLTDLKNRSPMNMAVLSPYLTSSSHIGRCNCCVWNKQLNDYKMLFMPIEIENSLGIVQYCKQITASRNTVKAIVHVGLKKKDTQPSLSQSLRKQIREILRVHHLPAAQLSLEATTTNDVVGFLCHKASLAVNATQDSLETFLQKWPKKIAAIKVVRGCAHMRKCPCRLYGDCKARTNCAVYKDTDLLPNGSSIGDMDKRCPYCDAHLFQSETSAICCMNGKVRVTEEELSQTIPDVMRKFKQTVMEDTAIFDRTMLINNNLSLASNLFNQRALKTAGERTLVIEGQYNAGICHVQGRDPKQPAFAQLYFTADENLNTHFVKFKWYTKKIQDYVRKLMTALKACNVLIQNYVTCDELLKAEKDRRKHEGLTGEPRLLMNIKNNREDIPHGVLSSTVHKGRINKPAVDNQVACIWVGDVPKQDELVDGLRVRERGGATLAPHFLPALDALLFVMLFPLGELGYVHDVNKYKRPGGHVRKQRKSNVDPIDEDTAQIEDNLNGCDELATERKEEQAKYVSRREWTLYMLARRGLAQDLKWHRILGWGKVSSQYLLFQWTRIEADRIAHITKNCTELRGVQQSALFDYLDNQLQTKQNVKLGSLTSMPASYTGGPGWLQTNYQDSMMVALEEGRPTFLITLTGNKDWEELLKHRIHKNDKWYTDPVMCARVFHEKLKMLLDDIRLGKIFGEVVALQYSIEYQKRGMPHAHILVTLKRKLTTPQSVDEVVCAELPILPDINDPTYDSVKQLRDKVLKHMIHRPCEGKDKLACRQGRSNCLRCNKCYPFPYCNDTYVSKNGHHVYRRRNNCAPFLVGGEGSRKVFATNAYIVPYNKWLLSKYDCHINVEVVCSATACKYIYKYIYKGPDHLVLELLEDNAESAVERQKRMVKDQNNQEVLELNMAKEHVNARYLSQVEAAYRILGYALAGSMHTVIRLYSHLPDNKYVWFVNGREPGEAKKSQLEAYFELIEAAQAANSPAKNLLWKNVAEQYVFDEKRRVYTPRKKKNTILAYIRFVPPKFVNQYALRLLLTQRPAGNFEELRTVNGVQYATFADAAVAAGYIRADEEWDRCLALVSHNAMPRELRRVFASLLVYCKVVNGKELWEKYKEQMRDRRPNCTDDTLDQFSLSHIEWILTMQGSSLDTCNMSGLLVDNQRNAAARYDPDDDIVAAPAPTGGLIPQLNAKQQGVMDTILAAIQQPVGTKRLFFLYGKAGCGKTFTYNRLIAECRASGKRVIAVASTGIAATLLDGGRTAHSTFKIPINLDKDSVIRLDARGQIAERLRRADLIVWDEAPMQSRYAMEAVDRMMRDIAETHRRQLPFGGATVVFGGDWSQFLPVVRSDGGTDLEAETIAVILKSSYLWPHVQVLTLDQNMRVVAGEEAHMKWLRMVGEGQCQHKGGPDINLPLEMYAESEKEIVDWMYTPDVLQSPERMGRVALLSVRNDDTLDLNEQILGLLPGQEYVLSSADRAADTDQQLYGVTESIEFIHSLTPSGMPPHLLKLKVGCIIMLTRNIDISNNLCNGTRLELLGVVQDRNVSLLRCRHLNGNSRNECFIQRMPLNYEDTGKLSGLAFERVQFPVRLAFAMTTNKSQGQTFDKVGLVLRTPAFAHGSTYVALSRCTSKTGIKVTMNRKPKKDNAVPYVGVRNIVYKSVI